MAESLLTFSARELLKKVAILAGEEFSLMWGFKKELARMRTTSVKLQAMLHAAENLTKDLRGDVIFSWVKEIEGIAGDADDLLDDFGYEVLRRKVELKNKVLSLFDPLVFRHKMGRKIKKINESLVNLEKQAASFHLVIAGNAKSDDSGIDRKTGHWFDDNEKNIIGRDEVVSDMVTTLISSNLKDLSVLAIVGMAGLGKTTVAKAIYNDCKIGRHFKQKIWICVSTTFEVENVLRGILGYVRPEAAVKEKAGILPVLQQDLKGKRYLLILDDVWNENVDKWHDLRNCLLSITGTRGSSIIVTTRNGEVAEVVEALPRHLQALPRYQPLPRCDLKKLSHDECWLILRNNAVPVGSTLSGDQEKTGQEIATKCGGVPLVVKVLGSLMHSKNNNEWLEIERSTIWDLEESDHKVFAVLKLSFSELQSPNLKKCFAYCSIFTKDVDMEKNDLIQLWMAMGLLEPSNEGQEEMENKGSAYFNTLLGKWQGNCLFQDVSKDEYGTITHCKMHDLLHDLAEHVSESMLLTRYSNNIRIVEHIHTSKLRTVLEGSIRKLFSNDEAIGRMMPGFKTLRVLKLYKVDIVELPNSIGKLKHLRYLDVSGTKIEALPKSIGKLYNLQTLRMPGILLEWLPKELENLINLRHIYFEGRMQFPVGIGKLTNLRSFTNSKRGRGCGIEELTSLNQLNGELCIYNLERVRDRETAKKANLVGKTKLRKLRFQWSQFYNPEIDEGLRFFRGPPSESLSEVFRISGRSPWSQVENQWSNDDDVLEGLEPPSNLEFLEIHRFNGDRFPLWQMSNLKEIELAHCSKCEGVPILGHLPNLNHVRIQAMHNLKCVGSEFYGYDHVGITSEESKVLFPKLKTLQIEWADYLTDWMEAAVLPTERVVVFPCLEELTLKRCEQLTSAPSHFPSLQKLVIENLDNAAMPIQSILSENLISLTSLKIKCVGGLTCLLKGLFENNENLAHLNLYACYDLIHIASPAVGRFASLKSLCIHGCRYLSKIPPGLLTPSLQKLVLSFCVKLKKIPDVTHGWLTSLQEMTICYCYKLTRLPRGLEYCTSLEKLEIRSCFNIRSIWTIGHGLLSLRRLEIRECGVLSILPGGLETCTSIRSFAITECPGVWAFPINTLTTSLQKLTLSKLEFLPTLPGGFTFLRKLTIESCNSPEIRLEFCASVQVLKIINCPNLEIAPTLDNLTSLRKLKISCCSRLTSLPSLVSLPCLKYLLIGPLSEELDSFPFSEDAISPHLETLELNGWPRLKSLPEEIQLFTSLTHLRIAKFDEMEAIPEWLGNLASLEELTIEGCESLKYLLSVGAMQRLTKLKELNVDECPLLERNYYSDESDSAENNPGGAEGDEIRQPIAVSEQPAVTLLE